MSSMIEPIDDDFIMDMEEDMEAETEAVAEEKPSPKPKKSARKERKKRDLTVTKQAKRGRGRPAGSISKTDEMRVEEGRKYRERVLQVYKNPRKNDLTSELLCTDSETGKERVISDKEPSLVGTKCTIDHGLFVPDKEGRNILLYEADKNSFNPVTEFLEKARGTKITAKGRSLWNNLGHAVTGRNDPFFNRTLQSFMVAAVARTQSPGVTVPFMPIIEGGQGLGKSSFLKELVPLEFRAEINSMPDQLLHDPCRMHVGWLIEMPECDRLFKPNQIENLKTLITVDCDSTRRPYAELPVKLPRMFVLLGTTNSKEFLVDTENRRFPILSMADGWFIQLDDIRKYRMQLWRLALEAYEKGYKWIPNREDLTQMAAHQSAYQSRDPWSSLIFRYIQDKDFVSPQAILESVLELSKKEMTATHSRRVAKILLQFGWERHGVRRVNGVSTRLFKPGANWNPDNIDL